MADDDTHAIVARRDDWRERRVRPPAERTLEVGEEDDRCRACLHLRGRRHLVANHRGQLAAASKEHRDDESDEHGSHAGGP